MATKDFRANQIETSKIIGTGSISGTTVGIAIYSGSISSNREGGISDSAMFDNVGSDVFLFVSGTISNSDFNRTDATLFGGDVVISGTLYAERQVIEVDSVADGDFYVTGNMYVEPDSNSDSSVVFSQADGTRVLKVNTNSPNVDINGNLIVTGNIHMQSDNLDGINIEAENNFQIGAQGNIILTIDSDNDDAPGSRFFGIRDGGGAYGLAMYDRGDIIFNNSYLSTQDFQVRADNDASAIYVDASEDAVAIGRTLNTDFGSESGVGADVKILLSGTIGSKDGSDRGVVLIPGELVVSGNIYDGSGTEIGNTLDQAYDQGGAGAGRIITADSGPVQIDSSGAGVALAITGSNTSGTLIEFFKASGGTVLDADIRYDNKSLTLQNNIGGIGAGHIIINPTDANANIVLGNLSTITNLVFNGHTSTSPSTPYIKTSAAGFSANLIIDVPNNQSVVINEDSQSSDFRVESDSRQGAILVDGGTNQVALLTDGTTAADAYGLNASADPIPSDIALYVSGAIGGKGTEGTSVFGGDVVVSGTLYGQSNSVIQEGLIVNNAKDGANTNDFTVYNDQSKKSIFVDSGLGDVEFFGNLDGPFLKIDSTIQEVVVNSYADRISHYDINFRVSSINLDSAILVDANDDQILIGSNEANAADENVGTDVVLFVSGTSGENGGKGTSGGATVIGTDLIVSGTYRGGYDALAGYESFQAVSDNYLFLTNLSDFGSSQIQATDSNFFFTGSIGSRGGATLGTAVFGGDVVTSGSLFVMTGSNQGIILESPNGTQFYLTVDNSGNLSTSPV